MTQTRFGAVLILWGATSACQQETFFQNNVDSGPDLPDAPSSPDDVLPPIAVCSAKPNPAVPGDTVQLFGEGSYDPDSLAISSYRWKLVNEPEGSNQVLPRGEANLLGFQPQVVGTYATTLQVTNQRGKVSDPCQVTLRVVPEATIFIEAIAAYPTDNIEILLELVGSSTCAPDDCPGDWGAAGDADDAVQVFDATVDDTEAIEVAAPVAGVYNVLLRDGAGLILGDNEVEVRVHIGGKQVWSGTHTFEKEPNPAAPPPIIPMAQIAMPKGTVTATAAP